MDNDAIPVLVEDEEATTPVPRQTMAELVYGAEFYFEEPALVEHEGEDYL